MEAASPAMRRLLSLEPEAGCHQRAGCRPAAASRSGRMSGRPDGSRYIREALVSFGENGRPYLDARMATRRHRSGSRRVIARPATTIRAPSAIVSGPPMRPTAREIWVGVRLASPSPGFQNDGGGGEGIVPSSLVRSSTTAGPGSITVQPLKRCRSDSASSRLRSSTSCCGASSGNLS